MTTEITIASRRSRSGREVKGKTQSAELIGLLSEAGVHTMERVAVPAHTRPRYQLASWCKRWAGLALAGPVQAERVDPDRGGEQVIDWQALQILFCTALCTAKLPRSTFCWLLVLLITRDFANFNSISRPSLRPHRAFRGLDDRHSITAGRLLGLDAATNIRQRSAAWTSDRPVIGSPSGYVTSPQG